MTAPVDLVDLIGTPRGVPPEIAHKFEELSLEVAARGYRRYSARAVMHRLRWHHQIEKGETGFKINNAWSARLSRWFTGRHRHLGNFFEQRSRQSDGGAHD